MAALASPSVRQCRFLPWFGQVSFMFLLAVSTTLSRSCLGWTSTWRHATTTRRRVTSMSAAASVIPRAAVSVVVRSCTNNEDINSDARFVLVQRGKEPNKGKWALPGGKIEAGETTLAAAKRELREETLLTSNYWHEVPFCSSDSIHCNDNGQVEYHYVISQCFCSLPKEEQLVPSDDAADAQWFSIDEMKNATKHGRDVMPAVINVVERAENMYQVGILQTATIAKDNVS